jgi:hypothetical protein
MKLAEQCNRKEASDYRRHAEECRVLATRMKTGEQRERLLEIAATWDRLAENRSDLVRKLPKC